jgi:type II secretory pathway component PulL
MSYPDLYANRIGTQRLRALLLLIAVITVLLALLYLRGAHNKMIEARNSLEAFKYAETLLPNAAPKRVVANIDSKQKAYLADLNATALKLSVDWGSRIASVESALGADLALNGFRVDGQRNEMELKGETASNTKLTAIVGAIQKTGLDARVGRMARTTSGLEYSILIAWPQ